MRKNNLILVFIIFLAAQIAYADKAVITAEQWARPRNGIMIVQSDSLYKLVHKFNKSKDKYLSIRYKTGDEGILWAEELRAWLVALGIPSSKVMLLPGLEVDNRIEIELESGKPAP